VTSLAASLHSLQIPDKQHNRHVESQRTSAISRHHTTLWEIFFLATAFSKNEIKHSEENFHFVKAGITADSSHLTAFSSASSSSCNKPLNVISRHMDCPKTLFRHRHFQVSDADSNPSSSSSHILILSSNCTFDTTVVLVVMFII